MESQRGFLLFDVRLILSFVLDYPFNHILHFYFTGQLRSDPVGILIDYTPVFPFSSFY